MTTESTDEEFAFQVESRLTSHGVYVTDLSRTDEGFRVVYQSLAADRGTIPHREVGRVINVFRDLTGEEWPGWTLEGVVTDLDDDRQATWRAEGAWLTALEADRLSEVDFSARVVDTIEPA